MGLDMYLSSKHYVKNWNHMGKEERHTISILKGGKPTSIPTDKITYIITEEMYWRKANAIHQWFVKNVQDGSDDCKAYYVSTENLKSLLASVEDVLADHSKASELLPSQVGFFFGSTDYDEWYFKDLESTKEELERILSADSGGEYEYESSW